MTFRGFIAVDIEASEDVKNFKEDLEKTGAVLKMVDLDKMHITLKFLGDTEEEKVPDISETIRKVIEDHEPFQLRIKDTGAFPDLGYIKVIWMGIENEKTITDIAHAIEEELVPVGFSRMERGFSPHITVARMKSAKNKEKVASTIRDYQGRLFNVQDVEKIELKKSVLKRSGPEYTTLEEYYL